MRRCVAATSALTVSRPERRRAVDDDVLVLAVERLDLVLEPEVRVELPHQARLELRQPDARRRDEQVRHRRRLDDVGERAARFGDRVVGAARDRREVEKRNAAVRLGVEIDEQRLLAAHRQGGGEVDGGRRLADAAFLVRDRYDHRALDGCGVRSALILGMVVNVSNTPIRGAGQGNAPRRKSEFGIRASKFFVVWGLELGA